MKSRQIPKEVKQMNRIEDVTNYITECDKEVGEALSLCTGTGNGRWLYPGRRSSKRKLYTGI